MRICISSGHGLYVRGASCDEPWGLDEVDEARKVVETVASSLREMGVYVYTFHDDTSQSQNENLETIVSWHNAHARDLDLSCHFNANEVTSKPMGCEVLYTTQEDLATEVSAAMADAGGFKDRGGKERNDLYFLNQTTMPAILLEVCFCDSQTDCELYRENYDEICDAIAETISGEHKDEEGEDEWEADEGVLAPLVSLSGKVSWFGGPEDDGVSPDEGLAFFYDYEDAPHLFLDEQPPGTTGLARRLNPLVPYIACRWDYAVTPKEMLAKKHPMAMVRAPKTGREFPAYPADWGPHSSTDRIADISPGLLEALGITTDDEVEVTYPGISKRIA